MNALLFIIGYLLTILLGVMFISSNPGSLVILFSLLFIYSCVIFLIQNEIVFKAIILVIAIISFTASIHFLNAENEYKKRYKIRLKSIDTISNNHVVISEPVQENTD